MDRNGTCTAPYCGSRRLRYFLDIVAAFLRRDSVLQIATRSQTAIICSAHSTQKNARLLLPALADAGLVIGMAGGIVI